VQGEIGDHGGIEWWIAGGGGTSEDSAQFRYLYRYSPLHNIKDTAYPAILILTGDHDDRVVPMHAYKLVAALQEKSKGRSPVLLLTEKNTGHQYESLDTEAEVYAFIYENMGVKPLYRLK
jgi:prolyl oligopeptidase